MGQALSLVAGSDVTYFSRRRSFRSRGLLMAGLPVVVLVALNPKP